MRRLTTLTRAITFGLALLQAGVPAAAAVADGVLSLDAARSPVRVHIEDHSSPSCRPVHPDACVLCQFLSHFSAPRPQTPPPALTGGVQPPPVRAAAFGVGHCAAGPTRTRAPPVV